MKKAIAIGIQRRRDMEDEINIEFDFDDQLLQILDRFRPENWADKPD